MHEVVDGGAANVNSHMLWICWLKDFFFAAQCVVEDNLGLANGAVRLRLSADLINGGAFGRAAVYSFPSINAAGLWFSGVYDHLSVFNPQIKAVRPVGVAGGSGLLYQHQNRVSVAIKLHVNQTLCVARGLAFLPQALTAA